MGGSVKIGFQPETGSASFPVPASLPRFLSARALQDVPAEWAGWNGTDVPPLLAWHNFLPFTDDSGRDHVYPLVLLAATSLLAVARLWLRVRGEERRHVRR